jgi:hypothetical protein
MDYRRSLADETLQKYIDDLRQKAQVDIAPQ